MIDIWMHLWVVAVIEGQVKVQNRIGAARVPLCQLWEGCFLEMSGGEYTR